MVVSPDYYGAHIHVSRYQHNSLDLGPAYKDADGPPPRA
jgi:hypothetical protein